MLKLLLQRLALPAVIVLCCIAALLFILGLMLLISAVSMFVDFVADFWRERS